LSSAADAEVQPFVYEKASYGSNDVMLYYGPDELAESKKLLNELTPTCSILASEGVFPDRVLVAWGNTFLYHADNLAAPDSFWFDIIDPKSGEELVTVDGGSPGYHVIAIHTSGIGRQGAHPKRYTLQSGKIYKIQGHWTVNPKIGNQVQGGMAAAYGYLRR
jgi:hypothetical protein